MKKLALIALVLASTASVANATADGCAVVLRTPDGFLNLRKAPMMGSAVIARLKPGEQFGIDSATCETEGTLSICNESWVHVISVPRLDGKSPKKKWT